MNFGTKNSEDGIICANCRALIKSGNFCANCGNPLTADAKRLYLQRIDADKLSTLANVAQVSDDEKTLEYIKDQIRIIRDIK